jgi:hypothetical protein
MDAMKAKKTQDGRKQQRTLHNNYKGDYFILYTDLNSLLAGITKQSSYDIRQAGRMQKEPRI